MRTPPSPHMALKGCMRTPPSAHTPRMRVRAVCRGDASAAGMLLRSWNAGGEGGTAVLYDWERGVLEAVFEGGGGMDLATQTDLDPDTDGQRRIGGPVDLRPGELLTVRALPGGGVPGSAGRLLRGTCPCGRACMCSEQRYGTSCWVDPAESSMVGGSQDSCHGEAVQSAARGTVGQGAHAGSFLVPRRCGCWWTTAAWRCT